MRYHQLANIQTKGYNFCRKNAASYFSVSLRKVDGSTQVPAPLSKVHVKMSVIIGRTSKKYFKILKCSITIDTADVCTRILLRIN